MPNLDKIADLINKSLKAGNFKSRKFQSGSYNLISDPLKTIEEKGEQTSPFIVDNDGEGKPLVYDDRFPFLIFHHIDNIEYSTDTPDNDYGNPGTTMREIANMRLVFAGSRKRMKVSLENTVAAINMDFPKEFLPSDITSFGLATCIIEMGSTDIDDYAVWNRYWQGTEFGLSSDEILFDISYKITSTFNKKCFNLCNE